MPRTNCEICTTPLDDSYLKRIVRVHEDGDYDSEGRVTTKIRTCEHCYPPKCGFCFRELGTFDITVEIYRPVNQYEGYVYKCHGCMYGVPPEFIPKNYEEYKTNEAEYGKILNKYIDEYENADA